MHKWILFVLLVAGLVAGGGILAGEINSRAQERAEAEAESKIPSLKITATNFKFDESVYTVNQGDTLQVSFRNGEGVHAIEITGYDVKLGPSNASQEVTFDKPGEYEIICSIMCGPGHDGMISKLIVQ